MTQERPRGSGGEFHRPSEARRILRIGRNQIYAAIAAGEIKAVKIGGQFRIPDSEIERLKRGEPES
jgi:excisionase family DNA binding protein